MNDSIIASIDAEIERLQNARNVLAGAAAAAVQPRKPGRRAKAIATATAPKKAKRVLSPEARKRIADAQKRRWAAAKATSAKKG